MLVRVLWRHPATSLIVTVFCWVRFPGTMQQQLYLLLSCVGSDPPVKPHSAVHCYWLVLVQISWWHPTVPFIVTVLCWFRSPGGTPQCRSLLLSCVGSDLLVKPHSAVHCYWLVLVQIPRWNPTVPFIVAVLCWFRSPGETPQCRSLLLSCVGSDPPVKPHSAVHCCCLVLVQIPWWNPTVPFIVAVLCWFRSPGETPQCRSLLLSCVGSDLLVAPHYVPSMGHAPPRSHCTKH